MSALDMHKTGQCLNVNKSTVSSLWGCSTPGASWPGAVYLWLLYGLYCTVCLFDCCCNFFFFFFWTISQFWSSSHLAITWWLPTEDDEGYHMLPPAHTKLLYLFILLLFLCHRPTKHLEEGTISYCCSDWLGGE